MSVETSYQNSPNNQPQSQNKTQGLSTAELENPALPGTDIVPAPRGLRVVSALGPISSSLE